MSDDEARIRREDDAPPDPTSGELADPPANEPPDDRERSFTRRALIRAGWSTPIVIAAMLPDNAYALSVGHADVHVDTHVDVVSNRHNDFDPLDPSSTPHTDLAHGDTHTDVHRDAPAPSHTDVGHSDGHLDTHNDDAGAIHTDQLHVDQHTDVHADGIAQPTAPIHVDAHDDSHTDSHVDSHVDHADAPAYRDTRHQDHSDGAFAGGHFDFACGPTAHQDSPIGPTGHIDHGDIFHRDHVDGAHIDHYDLASPGPTRTVHCDGPTFADHSDTHSDVHIDSAHSDTPHRDSSHGDSHNDTHYDVAHRDQHVDG